MYQGVAHPECGNTVKIIVRLLYRFKRSGIPFRLAAWHCGTAENFNPLDGAVTLTADAPQKQVNALLEAEFAVLDKEIADARYAGQMHIETGVRAQKALYRGQRGAVDAAVADAEQPLSRDRERGAAVRAGVVRHQHVHQRPEK